MSEKPEALRLADALEAYWAGANGHDRERQAAAELRRLHAENELLASAADKLRVAWRDEVRNLMKDKDQLRTQRDALLAEHQQTLALQQRSYEREIQLEVEAEREAIIQMMPGGHSVDPQWVCDAIRARSKE